VKFAKGLLLGGSLIFVKKITIVLSLLVTKLTKEKGNTLGTNCQGLVARRLSHFLKKTTVVLSLLVTKLTKEKGNTFGKNCQGLVARRLSYLKGVWALYVAAGFEFRIS